MIRSIVPAIFVLAATIAEARTEIVDIEDAAIPQDLSLAQVQKAITTGTADRGWIPKVLGSGHIEARLYIRSHTAVVDIVFDESKYSITYKDSKNLNYRDGKIHRNYNRWVANLSQALQRSLARYPADSDGQDPSPSPVATPSTPAATEAAKEKERSD